MVSILIESRRVIYTVSILLGNSRVTYTVSILLGNSRVIQTSHVPSPVPKRLPWSGSVMNVFNISVLLVTFLVAMGTMDVLNHVHPENVASFENPGTLTELSVRLYVLYFNISWVRKSLCKNVDVEFRCNSMNVAVSNRLL